MPRYYLNIRNSFGYTEDPEGIDVEHEAAARVKAIDGIRSILSSEVREGSLDLRGSIEIVDEAGLPVMAIAFQEAVHVVREERPS